jgi:hypothetical protein
MSVLRRISGFAVGCIWLAAGLLLGQTGTARAAIAVLLEQPYGRLNLVDPGGHSAVYLNHVCADGPLKLRACRAGELGVVLSRYDGIGEHDWVAVPLMPYLYAVPSAEEMPEWVDKASERALRDEYRRGHLEQVAPDRPDGRAPRGNWYELVGSAYDRTIYGFQLETTPEQDARLIAFFNDRRNNRERYNGIYRNCADFVRETVNLVYPHAVHRSLIADVGISSPKGVAKGISRYGGRHPEAGFSVFVVRQVEGSLPRSHSNTGVAEGVLKRYAVPLVVLSPALTAYAIAAYIGDGRFEVPKDAPVLDVSEVQPDAGISRPFAVEVPLLPAPVGIAVVRAAPAVGMAAVGKGLGVRD